MNVFRVSWDVLSRHELLLHEEHARQLGGTCLVRHTKLSTQGWSILRWITNCVHGRRPHTGPPGVVRIRRCAATSSSSCSSETSGYFTYDSLWRMEYLMPTHLSSLSSDTGFNTFVNGEFATACARHTMSTCLRHRAL